MTAARHDLWVFGYGSLMWRPGFAYEDAQHARLTGYRRCFCIYSVHHRGTARRPGLVLGLDRGGACEGIAYRVAARNAAETIRYLRAREQVNGVYRDADEAANILTMLAIALTQKLRRMIEYADTSACLRATILQYFGDTTARERCDSCGNCRRKSCRLGGTYGRNAWAWCCK